MKQLPIKTYSTTKVGEGVHVSEASNNFGNLVAHVGIKTFDQRKVTQWQGLSGFSYVKSRDFIYFKFESPAWSVRAGLKICHKYASYNIKTWKEFVGRWIGGEARDSHARHYAKTTGKATFIECLVEDPVSLLKAINALEAGYEWLSDSDIKEGLLLFNDEKATTGLISNAKRKLELVPGILYDKENFEFKEFNSSGINVVDDSLFSLLKRTGTYERLSTRLNFEEGYFVRVLLSLLVLADSNLLSQSFMLNSWSSEISSRFSITLSHLWRDSINSPFLVRLAVICFMFNEREDSEVPSEAASWISKVTTLSEDEASQIIAEGLELFEITSVKISNKPFIS